MTNHVDPLIAFSFYGAALALFTVICIAVTLRDIFSARKEPEIVEENPVTFENLFTGPELKEPLLAAIETIESFLVEHSGPFATNCIIGSQHRQINDADEFTKDGINILGHLLVSEDVAARVIVRLARFVGLAVDARCHDGTTTSMLTFCALARIAIAEIDSDCMSPDRVAWIEDLEIALNRCLAEIANLRITEEDIQARCRVLGIDVAPEEIRGAMAYHMAMISSKGDKGLSEKISHIIRSTPKKIYGMYRNVPLAIETKEPYIIKKQEHDLAIMANIGHPEHYNHRNDTQYLSEDAVIFATANVISAHSMETGFLHAFISDHPKVRMDLATFGVEKPWDELHEGKRHLIIVTPLMDDPSLIETINRFNYKNPKIKITWFHSQVAHKLKTSFNKTLHYMAGVPLFEDVLLDDASRSLIGLSGPGAKVQMVGNFLGISRLYERSDDVFHPLYRNPEAFQPYTDFCRETEEIIEFQTANVTNAALNHNELTTLTSFYRSLTCQEIYDIEVGGSLHDQRANQTVYEDAIGAALSAINEGVIMGGYAHLANSFLSTTRQNDGSEVDALVFEALTDVLFDSLRINDRDEGIDLLDRLNNTRLGRWSYLVADREYYRYNTSAEDYVKVSSLDKEGMENFLAQGAGNALVLLQAYAGYEEQFARFRDILPKLANTSNLVDMRPKNAGGA